MKSSINKLAAMTGGASDYEVREIMDQDEGRLVPGKIVMWRGGWGQEAALPVEIVSMELCEVGEKYGVEILVVTYDLKDRCVFVLDNGHWCYGNQIDIIRK